MGYRKLELPKHDDRVHRRVKATGSAGPIIEIDARAIKKVAFPCFYVDDPLVEKAIPHKRDHHDHKGWPNARSVDHSCQAIYYKNAHWDHKPEPYVDPNRLIPIDLIEEGYEKYSLECDYGVFDGGVDPEQPWVIRFSLLFPFSGTEPSEIPYTVYCDDEAAFTGIIRIMPTYKKEEN